MGKRNRARFDSRPAFSLPMKLSLATLAAFAIAATLGAGAGVGQGPPASYIVVFKNGVATDAKTLALEGQMGFTARHRFHAALHGFAAALTGPQLARIQQDADVAFVSEDRQVQATDAPLAPGETAPTGIRRVNAATTTTTQGSAASVNVAVIDTGIGLSNTDLNVQPGTNCVSPGSAPEDNNGHGTHVSGTIAAKNTGSRVVGVAPNTQLWAVKVLNAQGNGTWSQVICGIDWVTANASAHNIHVASMSLTGSGANDNNCGRTNLDALHLAICNSAAAGVTYVVAAGNSGANFSTFVPAAYPEAVTVTAVSDWDGQSGGTAGAPSCFDGILESDDAYASFSNFASTSDSVAMAHTIAAPGVCILSDWLSNGTRTISGTSMATPHVSGLVALCISAGACASGGNPSSIVSAIQTTDSTRGFAGDPNHSPVSGRYFGYMAWFGGGGGPPPPPDFTLGASPASQTVTQGGSAGYTVTITPSNGFSGSVGLSVSGLPADAGANFNPVSTTSTSTLTVTTSATTPAGSYPLTITGTSGSLTHTATATLVVNALAQADFQLTATPSSRSVTRGKATTYTITIGALNGFNSSVTLSVSGLPTKTSASFSPNPASPTSSSTLTVRTNRKASTGTFTLTVTGTSGTLTHTTTVTLTLT